MGALMTSYEVIKPAVYQLMVWFDLALEEWGGVVVDCNLESVVSCKLFVDS